MDYRLSVGINFGDRGMSSPWEYTRREIPSIPPIFNHVDNQYPNTRQSDSSFVLFLHGDSAKGLAAWTNQPQHCRPVSATRWCHREWSIAWDWRSARTCPDRSFAKMFFKKLRVCQQNAARNWVESEIRRHSCRSKRRRHSCRSRVDYSSLLHATDVESHSSYWKSCHTNSVAKLAIMR